MSLGDVSSLALTTSSPAGVPGYLFATRVRLGARAARLAALIEESFVQEISWDSERLVLYPPPWHPLLTRLVCLAPGCVTTAPRHGQVCTPCRRRLAERGLDLDQVASLPAQVKAGGPELGPLVPLDGACTVAACPDLRRHPRSRYCEPHEQRLRTARRREADLDEARWRAIESPIGRGGRVSLAGLPPLVIVEVLLGLQQRCRLDVVKTKEADLRAVCNDLRDSRVSSIEDRQPFQHSDGSKQALLAAIARHARRALSSPEAEVTKDEWDLAVLGHYGTVSFTAISQNWLRESTKAWAAEDLPRRRVRTGRRGSAGLSVRHHVGAVARLSESLRARPDRGEDPTVLGRADMEAFLHRLAYLTSTGQITLDARIRACREARAVLERVRALGLTRRGGLAAGLGSDFLVHREDIPVKPERAEAGRDLPTIVMRQICSHLGGLTSAAMHTAVELAIDTGRRPEEICDLAFDCLERDADGAPVLVYDNHKANRERRRLPISENTATVITTQQERVRQAFPHTPVGDLKLLPTDRRNPHGHKAITSFSLAFAHRAWITRMPVLTTSDGTEFDKRRIVLYAYRHTYAQRHADSGIGIDVLCELMDHRKLDTTKGYYSVGSSRRREAVDRVAALAFDRHGNRLWRKAEELIDSEHTRRALGEVVVPFGVCTEPSNVQAGGHACPYRFRCVGCDHFRTDISYLPDLHAHLDDLLRNRERLIAAADIDPWARSDEAMPSDEEITRIRRLINQISSGLGDLSTEERAQLDEAVATVRQHRTVSLGMPRTRQPLPNIRPETTP